MFCPKCDSEEIGCAGCVCEDCRKDVLAIVLAARDALVFVERNATHTSEGHVCGLPDSNCDCTCVEAAIDARLYEKLVEALKPWAELQ